MNRMLTVPVDDNNECNENPTQNNEDEDTDGVIPFDLKGTYCNTRGSSNVNVNVNSYSM